MQIHSSHDAIHKLEAKKALPVRTEQQKLLTDALESGEATVEFILGKNTFVVDLKAMTQTNKADKQRVRKVRYYVQGDEKKFINAPEKWLASDGFAKCGEHEQNVHKF